MAAIQSKSSETNLLQGGNAKFSSSGRFIAAAAGSKIAVYRNTQPVERVHIYACIDKIEAFEFSPDENFVLCALFSRNSVQVFSINDTNWKCRINEGPAGMISVGWVPDSQSIITESDFGIQLSVWSLVDNSQSVITLPKPVTKMHSAMATFNRVSSSIISFSDNRQFLAVVHRIELQDHIGVYSLNPLLEVNKFRTRTSDVAMIQWLPYDTHLITIDAPLYYKCAIYSPSGEMMTCFEAYQNALGIRCLGIFRPPYMAAQENVDNVISTSNLIAIGSFDSKIRLMTMFTWQVALTLPLIHPRDMGVGLIDAENPVVTKVELSKVEQRDLLEVISLESLTQASVNAGSVERASTVTSSTPSAISPYVTRMVKLLPKSSTTGTNNTLIAESSSNNVTSGSSATAAAKGTTKVAASMNNSIAMTSAVDGVALPAMGVHWMTWSASRTFLAASDEAYARCIWIWRPLQGKLVDLLIQLDSVTFAAWRPYLSSTRITSKSKLAGQDADSTSAGTHSTGGGQQREEHPSSMTDISSKLPAPASDESWEEDILAFTCNGQHVYLWSPNFGVRKIEVVNAQDVGRMKVRGLEWSEDGEVLLLRGKELFTTVHVSPGGNIL